MDGVLQQVSAMRIVPVVEIRNAQDALPLADALEAAGLPVMEITLRTPAAVEAIHLIAEARPSFLVGAGTVITGDDALRAASAGAKFLVSPGLTPRLAESVRTTSLPFIPGAVTASEAMTALAEGFTVLKFFPAETSGGAKAIAALSAPLTTQGIRFMPTGGVRPENLADYLALPSVGAVGGTWIATVQQLADGDFAGITERARAAVNAASDHTLPAP